MHAYDIDYVLKQSSQFNIHSFTHDKNKIHHTILEINIYISFRQLYSIKSSFSHSTANQGGQGDILSRPCSTG